LLRAGELFNIVIRCQDTLLGNTHMAPADIAELRNTVEGWVPKLRKLIDVAAGATKGRLVRVGEMDS
jgi:hypothetical protein